MLNQTFLSQLTTFIPYTREVFHSFVLSVWWNQTKRQKVLLFLASAFLVSIPVFFQAPLVRTLPLVSLFLTIGWFFLSFRLQSSSYYKIWGDLLWGFSWSWFCGSIYWGWLRWYPAIHIPVEAIGLPFALWGIYRGKGLIGNYFYLGSLVGTAITDLYFYIVGLIPYWQELMVTSPSLVKPLLQGAIALVQTPWGISWAILLANSLLMISLWALGKRETPYLVFASAVLSTIFTDALFLVGAYLGIG